MRVFVFFLVALLSIVDLARSQGSATPSGRATEVWGEGRFRVLLGSWDVQPNAGLRSAWYQVGEWAEAGADANVAEIVRYALSAQSLFGANPRVKAWYDSCVGRPAYRRMWAEREKEPA